MAPRLVPIANYDLSVLQTLPSRCLQPFDIQTLHIASYTLTDSKVETGVGHSRHPFFVLTLSCPTACKTGSHAINDNQSIPLLL